MIVNYPFISSIKPQFVGERGERGNDSLLNKNEAFNKNRQFNWYQSFANRRPTHPSG